MYRLFQIAMVLSVDNDRQRRINKLPADKLDRLKDKKREVEMVCFRWLLYDVPDGCMQGFFKCGGGEGGQ